jgi:hypothetical protein
LGINGMAFSPLSKRHAVATVSGAAAGADGASGASSFLQIQHFTPILP